eukprot:GDKJ01063717.1.p1 GENE.GDKJ01063717.1~~GDKJ01063717.1.p1  ORF type:complete len:2623 (+),score=628.70 GDKJ01063717.1:39-7907(+)
MRVLTLPTLLSHFFLGGSLQVQERKAEVDIVLPVSLYTIKNTGLTVCPLSSGDEAAREWRDDDLMGETIFTSPNCGSAPLIVSQKSSPTPEADIIWLKFDESRFYLSTAERQGLLREGNLRNNGITIDFLIAINGDNLTPRVEHLLDFGSFSIQIHYRSSRANPMLVVQAVSLKGDPNADGIRLLEDELCPGLPLHYTLTALREKLGLYRQGRLVAFDDSFDVDVLTSYLESGQTMSIGAEKGSYTGHLAFVGLQRRGFFFKHLDGSNWSNYHKGVMDRVFKNNSYRPTCLNGSHESGEGCDATALPPMDAEYWEVMPDDSVRVVTLSEAEYIAQYLADNDYYASITKADITKAAAQEAKPQTPNTPSSQAVSLIQRAAVIAHERLLDLQTSRRRLQDNNTDSKSNNNTNNVNGEASSNNSGNNMNNAGEAEPDNEGEQWSDFKKEKLPAQEASDSDKIQKTSRTLYLKVNNNLTPPGETAEDVRNYSMFLPKLPLGYKTCSCTCGKGCAFYKEYLEATNTPQTRKILERFNIKNALRVAKGDGPTLSCGDGFTSTLAGVIESEMLECSADTTWRVPALDCNKDCYFAANKYSALVDFSDPSLKWGPTDDIILKEFLKDGKEITVSCAPGYVPFDGMPSDEVLKCMDGRISRRSLLCAKPCPPLALDSSMKATGEGSGENAIREVTCAPGFSVAPGRFTKETVVCHNQKYSKISLQCFPLCKPFSKSMTPEEMASYSFSQPRFIEESAPMGSTVAVTCASGYDLSPRSDGKLPTLPQTISCVEKEWSPPNFRCHKPCPPYKGASSLTWSPFDSPVKFGDAVVVKCNYQPQIGLNYMLHADQTVMTGPFERLECMENGLYAATSIACFQGCIAHPAYDKIRMIVSDSSLPDNDGAKSKNWPVRHGSYVKFKCAEGYHSSTASQEGLSTCQHGVWSDIDLKCRKACDPFDYDKEVDRYHGTIEFKSMLSVTEPNPHGSVIHSNCKEGSMGASHAIRGLEHAVCVDGDWSILTIQCGNSCPPFDTVAEPAYAVEGTGLEPGSTRKISCSVGSGYSKVRGPSQDTVYCVDGKWSIPSILCKKDCNPFLELQPAVNYLVSNSSIPFPVMRQGRVPHGEWVDYTCAEDYAPESVLLPTDHVERIMCVEGEWTKSILGCMKNCPAQAETYNPKILNIMPLVYRNLNNSTHHGTSLELSCNNKLSQELPQIVTCSDGLWPKLSLQCSVKCRPWPTVTYATGVNSAIESVPLGFAVPQVLTPSLTESDGSSNSALYHDGAQIKHRCRSGFTNSYFIHLNMTQPEKINDVSTCTNGIWTASEVLCFADCPLVTSIFGSKFEIDNLQNVTNTHGSTATIRCKNGKTTGPSDEESEVMRCVDGKWSVPSLTCYKSCNPIPTASAGYMVSPSTGPVAHGSKRTIECLRLPKDPYFRGALSEWDFGYHAPFTTFEGVTYPPENAQDFYCFDGKWAATTVTCLKKCPQYTDVSRDVYAIEPDDVNESFYPDDEEFELYFAHGATRVLTCQEGYSHPYQKFDPVLKRMYWDQVKSDKVDCVDGYWSARMLDCQKQCFVKDMPYWNYTGSYVEPSREQLIDPVYLPNGFEFKIKCEETTHSQVPDLEELQIVRCVEGSWTNLGHICKAKCDFPHNVIDMFPSRTVDVQPKNDKYSHGAQIEVSCIQTKKYTAHHAVDWPERAKKFENERASSETLTCVDGKWSQTTLQCRRDCPPFEFPADPITNKKQNDRYISSLPSSLYWALVLEVAEASGMNLTAIRTEEINVGEADAEKPLLPEKALSIIEPLLQKNRFEMFGSTRWHGATRTITCSEVNGYTAPQQPNDDNLFFAKPQVNPGVSTVTCVNGNWTSFELECVRKCPLPITVASNPYMYSFIPFTATDHGSRVTISCMGEYQPAIFGPTQLEMVCLDGAWTGVDLVCEKQCKPFIDHIALYDTTLLYDAGVIESGDQQLINTYVANFQSQNSAMNQYATSKYTINGDIRSTIAGTRITISCADGFLPALDPNAPQTDETTIPTSQSIRCLDGKWEARTLQCERPCAAFIPQDYHQIDDIKLESNAIRAISKGIATLGLAYDINDRNALRTKMRPLNREQGDEMEAWYSRSTITISCNPHGWSPSILSSGNSKVTAQTLTCSDGDWSAQTLHCLPSCSKISDMSHLTFSYIPPAGLPAVSSPSLPHGTIVRVSCRTGSPHPPPPEGFSVHEFRCDRGSFSVPDIVCYDDCSGLPSITDTGVKVIMNGDPNLKPTASAFPLGKFSHGVEVQVMCSGKSQWTRNVHGGASFNHNQRQGFMNLNGDADFEKGLFDGGHGKRSSLVRVSYKYVCAWCHFQLARAQVNINNAKEASKVEGTDGPFMSVKCINGVWDLPSDLMKNQGSFCSNWARTWRRSGGSCVVCTLAWINGKFGQSTIVSDTLFGSNVIPSVLMKGYHAFGPSTVHSSKISPIVDFVSWHVFLVPLSALMEVTVDVLGLLNDDKQMKWIPDAADTHDNGKSLNNVAELNIQQKIIKYVYAAFGVGIIFALMPYTVMLAAVRAVAASFTLVAPSGLLEVSSMLNFGIGAAELINVDGVAVTLADVIGVLVGVAPLFILVSMAIGGFVLVHRLFERTILSRLIKTKKEPVQA